MIAGAVIGCLPLITMVRDRMRKAKEAAAKA
jgi:hypothetical protein